MPLQIDSSLEGTTSRITLVGELDASSAPAVRQTLDRLLVGTTERLIMEVAQLTFMASAGLRILIFAKQKQPRVKIYLISPQQVVVDTLKKTGFYDAVYITDRATGAESSVA